MITIQELEILLSKTRDYVKSLEVQLEALKKKQSEICPLEEGEEVWLSQLRVGKTALDSSYIRIEKAGQFSTKIVITSRWDDEPAREKANEIVKQFGGRSD